MPPHQPQPRVAIIGGGLAGLAAAVGLASQGIAVQLLEAKRTLGGRAGSFFDELSGELVDHCQHVGLGCCTNLADFFRRTETSPYIQRFRRLHFIAPHGRRYDLKSSWLPAPMHLFPSFSRLGYLTLRERYRIGKTMLRLARESRDDDPSRPSIGDWLRAQGETPRSIERFWSLVLVSALSEQLGQISIPVARKVIVDGFMASRGGFHLDMPRIPLGELYGRHVSDWLARNGCQIQLGTRAESIIGDDRAIRGVRLHGQTQNYDAVILAVHWRQVGNLLPAEIAARIPRLAEASQLAGTAISSLHLWFDRPITKLPHAALVGRLAQWIFHRSESYYQVVISAADHLTNHPREKILGTVLRELGEVFPQAGAAQLLRWKMLSQRDAVFSPRPGVEQLRPAQATPIPNLALAGDWTSTGWPATMEGAVRSGYLAAEAILNYLHKRAKLLAADLPTGWLARQLCKPSESKINE